MAEVAQRDSGFTLLEALIAFAIAALALAALLPMTFDSAARSERATATRVAVMHAESKLAAIGRELPLAPGETSGSIDNRYRWSARIEPAALGPSADGPGFESYDVLVRVLWGDAKNPRSVILRTLRIGPKRAPGQ